MKISDLDKSRYPILMGRGNSVEEILYGQVGPRSSSEGYRLDALNAEIQARLQEDNLHGLNSVPEDFFSALAEGCLNDDPRAEKMIQHIGAWIGADSITVDTVEAAYQLLAYGPAVAHGIQADGTDLDKTYRRLVQKCLAHKLAYVNPDREALDQRIQELIQARDLRLRVLPRLAAKADKDGLGMSHYLSKDGGKTACGHAIKSATYQGADDRWAVDLTREGLAEMQLAFAPSDVLDPVCSRCAGVGSDVGSAPLTLEEQSAHAAKKIAGEVPEQILAELGDRKARHPLEIQKMIEQEIWSMAVHSLLLEEPLSDHDKDYLAGLEPGDVII